MRSTRRRFLVSAWKAGAGLLGAAATWTGWEALRPLASNTRGGKMRLGSLSKFEEGSATYFPESRLYVVNARGNLFALSQRCPHLGCRVPFCESSGRFECPCHGTVFDLAGEWVQGPSPHGMNQYRLELVDDALVADTDDLIEGPPRGADAFLDPPLGPSCVE